MKSRGRNALAALAIAVSGCTSASSNGAAPAASSAAVSTAPAESAQAAASASAPASSSAAAALPAAAVPTSTAAANDAPEGMVRIPAGFFIMGGSGMEDMPRHEVAVAAFYYEKTEVTMDAYAKCVEAKKCDPPKDDNPFCNIKFKDRGNHPVNCVDFHQATAYCAFIGSRLPSEREWEYAARGGAEERLYSWGAEDPTDKRACYAHPGGSCPVASFAPGAFGLYDVNGDVWEWTSSYFAPYPDEAASGMFRVYRGGSWSRRFPKWLRNDLRNRYAENEDSAQLGIRCARTVEPLECPADADAKDGKCVRARGTPMDPEYALAQAEAGGGGGSNGAGGPAPSSTSAATDATDLKWADEKPMKIRSPEFDEDCKHYPGFPTGYTWRGGKNHEREPIIRSSGCKKRDTGVGWTSVCCPS